MSRRPSRVLAKLGLALVAPLAIFACQDVSVTAVDVASVTISLSQGQLVLGDTLRLTAIPRDASGRPLQDRSVSWSSDDPAIASVSSDGLVQAISAGETRIRAKVGDVESSVLISVQHRPEIVLSESEVRFEGISGQGLTSPRTVQVTGSGGGTLSGLSVDVDYPSGSAGGWLEANLQGSQTPASLVLRASPAALSPGTYRAEVRVAAQATGTSPRVLPVEFTVGAPAPSIRLSSTAVGFVWEEGQALPPGQSVSITNGGGGSLTGLGTSVRYQAGEPTGWLSVQLGATSAPATLTLGVDPGGLSTGVYSAFVDIGSSVAANSPQEIRVRLTVGAPPPQIELSPLSVDWTIAEEQDVPSARLIDVRNLGSGELSGLTASLSYGQGQPAGWLDLSLSSAVAPAVVTLTLTTTELVPGGYDATVEVASDEAVNSPQAASVHLTVLPRVAPELSEITADPEAIDADGQSTSLITVLLRDPRGDPMPFGGANVELTSTAGTLGEVVDHQDGTYTAILTAPTMAGVGVVSGTVDGVALGDSATVEFVGGSGGDPISASLSSVTADPSTGVEANGSNASTVTVVLRDEDDSPVEGRGDSDFSIALTGNASRTTVTETSTSGTYAFDVTNTTAETVTVTVTADGVTLDDQPTIEFVADSGPVSASLSSVSAKPDTGVVADGTTASTVSLRIRDPDGDFVNGLQNDDFTISLSGSAQASTVRSRNPPGAYEFDVTNTVAEVVTVTVTVLGVTLDDRPTIGFVAGGVSGGTSSASASPSTGVTADESDPSTVTVELRDANGNPVGELEDEDFSIDVSGDGEDGPVSESGSTGTYTFKVTNGTAETVAVTIEADHVLLADEPTIEFVAGEVAGGKSSAEADPSSGLVPNGSDTSTVTVELRDANDNPVGGLADADFSIELTGDAVRTAVAQTDTVGTYTFGVTNTTAEETTVTIIVHGSTVDDQPKIAFDGEAS